MTSQYTTFPITESIAFHYAKKVKRSFEEVITQVTENLQKQGFNVITIFDVKEAFKKQFGMTFRNYEILGVCNPEFAYKLITIESHMGLMLPCNILIQEHENGEVEVSAMNPLENVLETMNADLEFIHKEISNRIRKALDNVN